MERKMGRNAQGRYQINVEWREAVTKLLFITLTDKKIHIKLNKLI